MGLTSVEAAQAALGDDSSWRQLVETRLPKLRNFLRWAKARERETSISLRLVNRDDVERCRGVLDLFDEPWWAVVVYSCFDSDRGTRVAATRFRVPLARSAAIDAIANLAFPRGSVQHHRAQSTLAGAKRSLASACDKELELRAVLLERSTDFDERNTQLRRLKISWWGRTTCFDALIRAGALNVAGVRYQPTKAYLLGSTGPSAGFEELWGVKVTSVTADVCEQLLARWTDRWWQVCDAAEVQWDGEPYRPGDFENALCVYQERPRSGQPDPTSFG